MGLVRAVYYSLISSYALFLILNHVPHLLNIDPQPYTPILFNFEGGLALNNDLENGEFILENEVIGPESLAFKNGGFYASLSNGRIVFSDDERTVKVIADTNKNSKSSINRPAGLRFVKDDLYVADVGRGLLKVDIKTGKVTDLIRSSDLVEGVRLGMANDLDIDDQGVIYFSDFNTKWDLNYILYGIFEHDNSGRVLTYDTRTGKTAVLIDKLYSPNGIQLTHDKKSLLISEFTNRRILRHHLQGPQKGVTEIFAQLPGEPDNIRPSSGGGYWVAMFSSRNSTSPHLIDRLGPFPGVRKFLARMSHGLGTLLLKMDEIYPAPWLYRTARMLQTGYLLYGLWSLDHSIVVELGEDGTIIRSLHSDNPQISLLSQCSEHEGHLYIGTFMHNKIVKVQL